MNRNTVRRITLLIVLMASPASLLVANEPGEDAEVEKIEAPKPRDWQLRFGFLVADTNGETSVAVDPGSVNVSLSGGGGGFISLERRVTPLLGIEFVMTGMGVDMNVSTRAGLKHCDADVDILSMGSLTLGANFHFVNDGPIDVYAGPLLAFNSYNALSVRTGFDDDWVSVRTKGDSEFTWGAKAGLDIPLGKKKLWSLGFSLTFINATYEFEQESEPGRASISIDPSIFSFGAGFRF